MPVHPSVVEKHFGEPVFVFDHSGLLDGALPCRFVHPVEYVELLDEFSFQESRQLPHLKKMDCLYTKRVSAKISLPLP